jgi:5-methylcytosine-specific restriction protein B
MSTINFIIKSLSKDDNELTEEKIKSIIESNGYKWGDIQLSDYCYNRYNNGEKFPKVFEYISRGKYIYLGEKYNYEGEIYWKPKGEKEEIVIGKWINGEREIYTEKFIDKDEDNNENEETKMNIKNIILYGVPGVGKTHNYKKLVSLIEQKKSQKEVFKSIQSNDIFNDEDSIFKNLKEEKRVEFITFHQSFGYEDFIEGFRPNKEGNITLENGIFKNICQKAQKDLEKNFYLVIDEINRGNISKVFGELITLIEESKRDDYEVILPYSKQNFSVPSNLFIIGTMNSTDKSIALIDVALRRRFTFIKMQPNPSLIKNDNARTLLLELNEFIKNSSLGEEYQIGHSYFMNIDDSDLDFVKEYKIKPLLEEYFYGDEKLDEVLEIIKSNNEK